MVPVQCKSIPNSIFCNPNGLNKWKSSTHEYTQYLNSSTVCFYFPRLTVQLSLLPVEKCLDKYGFLCSVSRESTKADLIAILSVIEIVPSIPVGTVPSGRLRVNSESLVDAGPLFGITFQGTNSTRRSSWDFVPRIYSFVTKFKTSHVQWVVLFRQVLAGCKTYGSQPPPSGAKGITTGFSICLMCASCRSPVFCSSFWSIIISLSSLCLRIKLFWASFTVYSMKINTCETNSIIHVLSMYCF